MKPLIPLRKNCSLTILIMFLILVLWFKQLTYEVSIEPNAAFVNNQSFKNDTCSNASNFIETIRQYPWENLLYAYQNKKTNTEEFSFWCSKLLLLLTPALITPPKVTVNVSCEVPPTLQFPSNVPHCERLTTPRKVAVLLQFGFDADILEIHFRELYDIVDKFFIIESTATYYLGVRKPLIWDAIKGQPRFENFLHKVVHFVLDDEDILGAQLHTVNVETGKARGNIYSIESLQEQMRWIKFLKWNDITNDFDGNDLLGFGDSDEIPNRNVIYYLKHCEMPSDPVDIGIWFPFGRIDQAFQTDWPVKGHPYSYGDPTYWTLNAAMAYGAYFQANPPPNRQRGRSPGFMIGGMHMTHYGYFPFQLAKTLTKIEGTHEDVQNEIVLNIQFVMNELKLYRRNETLSKDDQISAFKNMEAEFSKVSMLHMSRTIKLELFRLKYPQEYMDLAKLPWFYDCNRERYPLWEGKHDRRFDE